jgi:hypothetical protein
MKPGPMKSTTGRRIPTGAPAVGIGSSTVNTFLRLFRLNTTPSRTDAFEVLAYDRGTQCLEVRFKWRAAHQIPSGITADRSGNVKARPVNVALDNLMRNGRVHFDEVRSGGKVLVSMLRGLRILSTP